MAKRVEKLGSGDRLPSLEGLQRIKMIRDTLLRLMRTAWPDPCSPPWAGGGGLYGRAFDALVIEDGWGDPAWNQLRKLCDAAETEYEGLSQRFGHLEDGKISLGECAEFLRSYGSQYASPKRLYGNFQHDMQRSENEPVKLDSYGQNDIWIFKGCGFRCAGSYSDDQFRLLILEEFDKERRHFEKLRLKFDTLDVQESVQPRPRISEKARIEVWRRDGGKCARCGSRERLEYDHIVPISKGGSNTTRNIELLCEKCNRSKGSKIE